jgi:hypothetical protein
MGRPKAANFKTFHLYDKLHTKKTKMMSGVEMTTLYPIKETEQFFISPEVWAYCASKFRAKKKNGFKLNVDIPVITDEKTEAFLAKHCWKDFVQKETDKKRTDFTETVALFKRIFPDKEPIFFYELDSLINLYIQGSIVSYDRDGKPEPLSEHDIENQKYCNSKYNRFPKATEVKEAEVKWTSETDEKKKEEYLTDYIKISEEHSFKNNNLIDVFLEIGKNSVCYPVAFSHGTADWHKKEYGKKCPYAEAGEIFFVVTKDKVYFEVKRHF